MNNYDTGTILGINSEIGFLNIGQLDDIGNRKLAMARKPDCFYIPNPYTNFDAYLNNGNYGIEDITGRINIVKEPLFISEELGLGIIVTYTYDTIELNNTNFQYIVWGFFEKDTDYITETNTEGWKVKRLSDGTYCYNYTLTPTELHISNSPFSYMWNNANLREVPIGFYVFTNNAEPRPIYLIYGIYHSDDRSIYRLADNLPSTWSTKYEYTDILFQSNYLSSTKFERIDNINIDWQYKKEHLSLLNSESIPQGGINDGSYDNSSDDIEVGSVPTFNAILTNMISIFSPTTAQIQSFADFLWSDSFNEQVKQNWIKPLEMIVSSHILPFHISTTGSKEVSIGGIDTGLTALTCNQYAQINCGTLKIDEYYANFIDYNSTKIKLYLPFVGIVDLSCDDAMGSEITIIYNVDCLNGEFICFVKCYKENVFNAVTYTYNGNMAIQIPITNVSYMQKYGQAQQVINGTLQGLSQVASGDVVGGISNVVNSGINYAFSQKAQVNRTGGTSTTPYYMGVLKPYLILQRPIVSIPKNYDSFNGYPSNITRKLKQLSGYTAISKITFDNMNLTSSEKEELETLLSNGIYI